MYYLMEVESDCKKTASISMIIMNKRIVWPEESMQNTNEVAVHRSLHYSS